MFRHGLSLIFVLSSWVAIATADTTPYAGWTYLTAKLQEDGVREELLSRVYDGVTVPPFGLIPFKLKPVESHSLYKSFLSKSVQEKTKLCERIFQNELKESQEVFKVDAKVIASLLYVETHCGKNVGSELVVNRLSRVASVRDPQNIQLVFEKLQEIDPSVTIVQVEDRAKYLEETFYPQLLALFTLHTEGALDIFNLKGSIAGAFGWPQFLPLTVYRYGVDGDQNGLIDLFSPKDAILSIGHFLAAQGWNDDLPEEEKRKIIWKYNRSEPYIDTVLMLSRSLEGVNGYGKNDLSS